MGLPEKNVRRCTKQIRVLIVDDSALVRRILCQAISQYEDMLVVGTASDPFIARDKILELRPDVVTLDLEMPRMDGLTFLKKIMKYHPLPVIVISSVGQASAAQAMEAMRLGAVEVFAKPNGSFSVGELVSSLPDRIRAAAQSKKVTPVRMNCVQLKQQSVRRQLLIAIGASTGGTDAIEKILIAMPPDCPPILVAQHIPAGFSAAFANRLDSLASITVKEAEDGDAVVPGCALVAPGNFHMFLQKSSSGLSVGIRSGPMVCYQRPSVDVLFKSIAECLGDQCVAVLLTGMGSDGAQGLLKLRQTGARTITQDEASCVVYGMPREAVRIGASEQSLPLDRIASVLLEKPA